MDGLLIWLQKYKYYFDTPNFNPEKWSQALGYAAWLSKEPTPWYVIDNFLDGKVISRTDPVEFLVMIAVIAEFSLISK